MVSCTTVRKRSIRSHYNISTLFYRLLWGEHIHHGYWNGDESVAVAQRQLIDMLASAGGLAAGQRVLDVGCGMGGSTRHLAKHFGCDVTGVTISPVQRSWATMASLARSTRHRTRFVCADAEQIELPAESFDAVWSVECTEHLFDKAAFFRRACQWLRPGGRVAICAWLAGDEPLSADAKQQVYQVCENFFCPVLGSMADYRHWMEDAGLEVLRTDRWTEQVTRTWEICQSRIERFGIRRLAAWIDREQVPFLDHFTTLLNAYRTGAMQYGCIVAQKPC